MRSEISIWINAAPDTVFPLVADLARDARAELRGVESSDGAHAAPGGAHALPEGALSGADRGDEAEARERDTAAVDGSDHAASAISLKRASVRLAIGWMNARAITCSANHAPIQGQRRSNS